MKAELPLVEHRWCAVHIFSIWKKIWRGSDVHQQYWRCAKSFYEQHFTDQLKKLNDLASGSIEHLLTYPPHTWCRSYFSFSSKCDSIENNMCESYNGHLVKARNKHILGMLEWMRVDVMNRLYTKRDDVMKWCTDVSPSTIERLDKKMERASQCIVEMEW